MCDAWESDESYRVCEHVRQLGALYDKKRQKHADDARIEQERRLVSLRLIATVSRLESGHSCKSFIIKRASEVQTSSFALPSERR